MIKINEREYEDYSTNISIIKYVHVNRKGKAPLICFKNNDFIIRLETNLDVNILSNMELNIKDNITKYISDISYEDSEGWISLIYGEHDCYIERINNNSYRISLEINDEEFKININEILNIE